MSTALDMDRRFINNWRALVACTRWGALSKIACLGSIGLARPFSCLHQRFTPKSARHFQQRCRFSRKSQLRACLSLRPLTPRVFELRIDSINDSATPSVSVAASIHRAALTKPCTRSAALSLRNLSPLVGCPWRTLSSLLPAVPRHSHWVTSSEHRWVSFCERQSAGATQARRTEKRRPLCRHARASAATAPRADETRRG